MTFFTFFVIALSYHFLRSFLMNRINTQERTFRCHCINQIKFLHNRRQFKAEGRNNLQAEAPGKKNQVATDGGRCIRYTVHSMTWHIFLDEIMIMVGWLLYAVKVSPRIPMVIRKLRDILAHVLYSSR